ncbi:MAG: UDP-N-acetylmuramoyl-L-alanyl-D-glutamate--2,6-diaminopimelate ligase [Desulfobacterales bacterium]|nr:UDP-N-acetylmuramoyl-L-alanyl-D-glutamate--2,6-diaminopimelate ligase [Desulfobacterales bacterium]MDD3950883.1 UDP-N-acetylmuramoyl-L-alanyl-D-glutamate--2,6-diaminopimelate ligase [Desulfobacterales bacterium]
MKLSQLIKTLSGPMEWVRGSGKDEDPEITAIHCRADAVSAGGLFVAVCGFKTDGHRFVDEAIARGASAVLVSRPVCAKTAVVQVPDTRRALSALAARFYGDPSLDLFMIGITGTNGKTTTSFLIERILIQAGFNTGVIGTINCRYGGKIFENPMTTPESLDFQRILSQMRDSGVTHVVAEISSHAIDLGRIADCWFDVGLFTNLSQDHLDYHRTMDEYWQCKRRFFTEYLAAGPKRDRARAVVNTDHDRGRELARELDLPVICVGRDAACQVQAIEPGFDLSGIRTRIRTPRGTFSLHSPLVGAHNLENILCAAGAAVAAGIENDVIRQGIEAVGCVPGRLEGVPDTLGRFVYVDYAHSPDALENVINTLKPLGGARIICLFGCGGDRDAGKRPLMGQIAARLCDLCVITSDNPRSESPTAIIDQILEGVRKQKDLSPYTPEMLKRGFDRRGYVVVPDRRSAIALAIGVSRPGDVVLLAGKGHETYQLIGARTFDFDDRIEARKVLGKRE